jgi:hypothetical protein
MNIGDSLILSSIMWNAAPAGGNNSNVPEEVDQKLILKQGVSLSTKDKPLAADVDDSTALLHRSRYGE